MWMRFVLALSLLVVAVASAKEPIVLFDASNINDESFNKAAYGGLKSFENHKGKAVAWAAPAQAQEEAGLKDMVDQALAKGYSPIISVGFPFAPLIQERARRFPDTHFVLIDSVVDVPNAQSVLFREEQGAFLVGALAAMATQSKKLGFIGGRDSDMIRTFACGFAQGAKQQQPKLDVRVKMAGTSGLAFRSPEVGKQLTRALHAEGVDVVFHAAGGTGIGVIEAARELGILAIGVDLNQNHLAPGTMLTSMLKRIDVAVYAALSDADANIWQPGIKIIGLDERAVGWALDQYNLPLVSSAMQSVMGNLEFDVTSGELRVHRYADTRTCPYLNFPALSSAR